MSNARYLTAKEAAALLDVKEATLYAYVSRGLIRSEAISDAPRQRLYLTEDVQKLAARKVQRRDPAKAARDALHWGTPMLESALTLITEHALYYRGYDVAQLARERTLEEVATLLWTGGMDQAERLFTTKPLLPSHLQTIATLHLPTMQRLQVALTLAATDDLSAYDLRPDAVVQTGARILWLMAAVAAQVDALDTTLAGTLAQAWQSENTALLNAALILCADHELNASSFTARVVASAGANPYAVVLAGLAALGGFKHGGQTERASAFLREVGEASRVRLVIAERLRRGERLPGFGHRLYPESDPRTVALLSLLADVYPTSPALTLAQAVIHEATAVTSGAPTIDFALAVLEQVLQLSYGTGLTLFAFGRTVGWLGHALEQYQGQHLIRPRARYIGVPPRQKEQGERKKSGMLDVATPLLEEPIH
jgi:citrate synthase